MTDCPECAKRLPPLPEGKAPLDGCKCRLCEWLRSNATYERKTPRPGATDCD